MITRNGIITKFQEIIRQARDDKKNFKVAILTHLVPRQSNWNSLNAYLQKTYQLEIVVTNESPKGRPVYILRDSVAKELQASSADGAKKRGRRSLRFRTIAENSELNSNNTELYYYNTKQSDKEIKKNPTVVAKKPPKFAGVGIFAETSHEKKFPTSSEISTTPASFFSAGIPKENPKKNQVPASHAATQVPPNILRTDETTQRATASDPTLFHPPQKNTQSQINNSPKEYDFPFLSAVIDSWVDSRPRDDDNGIDTSIKRPRPDNKSPLI